MPQSLLKFLKGFGYAFEGVKYCTGQRNFRIHLVVALLVISAGIYFSLNPVEWALIFLATGAVLSAELFNTAIEELANLLNQHCHLKFEKTWDIRNLSAAGVLAVSCAAVLIGLIVFLPKVL